MPLISRVTQLTLLGDQEEISKCGNIKTLFNFEPPATNEEIDASAIQFVQKLSGFTKPSKVNETAFERSVEDVTRAARRLVNFLETAAESRDDEEEAIKWRAHGRPTVRPGWVHWPIEALQKAVFLIL